MFPSSPVSFECGLQYGGKDWAEENLVDGRGTIVKLICEVLDKLVCKSSILLSWCWKTFYLHFENKLTKRNNFLVTLLFLSSSFVFNWAHEQFKKKIALLKGPGNWSKYRLSLLLFFAYGGLPRGKKFLRIWTGASVKTKYILYFWWEEINYTLQDFSRQKTVYFLINTRQFKSADLFFPFFPPKDLIFFRKYFSVFWAIPKKMFQLPKG